MSTTARRFPPRFASSSQRPPSASDRRTAERRLQVRPPGQVDAVRAPAGGVERVDEGGAVRLRVERVRPGAVRAPDARPGRAVHLLVRLALVDERAADRLAGDEADRADVVARVRPGAEVLGRVQDPTVGREGVVGPEARKRDRLLQPERRRGQHGEARLGSGSAPSPQGRASCRRGRCPRSCRRRRRAESRTRRGSSRSGARVRRSCAPRRPIVVFAAGSAT